MPVEMALWKIKDGKLHSVASRPLNSEEMLENWLADDISMVSEDLLVIGRQVASDLGGVLDLLAIDINGDLAVLELKRHLTPRDVVAQALHYAAWVRTLSWEDIEQTATEYYKGKSLEDVFRDHFEAPIPDVINTAHQVYIVAAEMDPVSETIVRYLSEEYSANINVIFFRHFYDADKGEFLGRSWLMEPSEVKVRGGKRPPPLTFEQFQDLANKKGVGEQYRALFEFFSEQAQVHRTQSNVAFAFQVEGGQRRRGFSAYPVYSSTGEGLYTDVRPERLASAFDVPESDVRDALPGPGSEDVGYGELHYFKTIEQVQKLIKVLSASSEEELIADDTRKPE